MRHIVVQPGKVFLEALRDYQRGAKRLLKGAISETELETLYERMMASAHIASELRPVMVELPEVVDGEYDDDFTRHEIRIVADTLGMSKNRASKIILKSASFEAEADAPNALIQALAENHASFMSRYRQTIREERKIKKKHRRTLIAAIELGIGGAIVTTSNALTIGVNPFVSESITFGGGMILKSVYDIRKG